MNHPAEKKLDDKGAKEKLLRAGISLFAEKGYASTSVREIVEKAGVSKPVLYYYFKSKEGLFLEILNTAAARQEAMLARVLEMSGSVSDRLVQLSRETYQIVQENRDLFKMIHNLILGPPQGAPDYDLDQFHRRMINVIEAIYLEGTTKNDVKQADSKDVAFVVLGLIDFCFHLDHVRPELLDPERPERLLRLAFHGFLTMEQPPGERGAEG
ncbi:MAG: TetR/AcrR family transcriptional regulator [Pseudomonadota bacterium]